LSQLYKQQSEDRLGGYLNIPKAGSIAVEVIMTTKIAMIQTGLVKDEIAKSKQVIDQIIFPHYNSIDER